MRIYRIKYPVGIPRRALGADIRPKSSFGFSVPIPPLSCTPPRTCSEKCPATFRSSLFHRNRTSAFAATPVGTNVHAQASVIAVSIAAGYPGSRFRICRSVRHVSSKVSSRSHPACRSSASWGSSNLWIATRYRATWSRLWADIRYLIVWRCGFRNQHGF